MFIKIFSNFKHKFIVYEMRKLLGTFLFLLTVFPNCTPAKYSHIRKRNGHNISRRPSLQNDVYKTGNEPFTSSKAELWLVQPNPPQLLHSVFYNNINRTLHHNDPHSFGKGMSWTFLRFANNYKYFEYYLFCYIRRICNYLQHTRNTWRCWHLY